MPWLFRPPVLARGRSSDFSGFFLRSVIVVKSLTVPNRRPGVTGLYYLMPMGIPPEARRRPWRAEPSMLSKAKGMLAVPARRMSGAQLSAVGNDQAQVEAMFKEPTVGPSGRR
jgi:hypothetical protein